MAFKNFKVETDADGIALVTWDMPGRSMNVLDETSISELEAIVKQTSADAAVKGVVITSGKEALSAGADLSMLEGMSRTLCRDAEGQGRGRGQPDAVRRRAAGSRRCSARIETSGKPWVAAINGLALGGGFELTLACHYRVAAENPKTRLGLPEVKVGLFPGAGGTQRVPRIVPPQDAMQLLLKGEAINLDKAKALKLVDAVVPAADLIKAAKDWIKGGGKAVAPWDEKGFKLPGGPVYSKAGMMMFPAGNAIFRRETYDNYPAARAIMQCVYEGLQLPIDAALRVESRYFAQILRSKEAAAMIRSLFLSMQELNKGARRPPNVPPTKVKKLAVIGAGFMGASVGYVSARAGIDVVLIDRDQESADKGKGHAQSRDRRSDQEGPRQGKRPRRHPVAHQRDRRLQRAEGLRSRHRSGVRGSQGQGRNLRQGAAAVEARRDLRLQHLDPADQFAGGGIQGPGQVHRHSFLLAGREDDAGGDHRRQEHRRRRARDRAGLRARDRQDADRGQ